MTRRAEQDRRQLQVVERSAKGGLIPGSRKGVYLALVKRAWGFARRKKPPLELLQELREVVLWLLRAAILFGAAYQFRILTLH